MYYVLNIWFKLISLGNNVLKYKSNYFGLVFLLIFLFKVDSYVGQFNIDSLKVFSQNKYCKSRLMLCCITAWYVRKYSK